MRSGEAHAADSWNAADAGQELREIPACGRRIAIAVHVLSEQLNFAVPRPGELARFGQHGGAGAASLRSARERYHAICAGFIAALDDGDVGAMRIVAAGERRIE